MATNSEERSEFLTYRYIFTFANDEKRTFTLELESATLNMLPVGDRKAPEWARLDHYQCENCPLTLEEHPHCPVAVSIADLVTFAGDSDSFEKVHVEVQSDTRTYSAETSLQKGVSSVLGLHMVTSGCPVLAKLKPMVRFHLPFSTLSEVTYRTISMYLVSQYFAQKRGKTPDWSLGKLRQIYDDIHIVNQHFWQRLAHLQGKDANVNALLLLDNSGTHLQFQLDEGLLSEIELLCDQYFE
jgi:hypothetical protein